MSIRDYPSSSKWFLPLVAGLQLTKAYDPSTGGVGTEGGICGGLESSWVYQPLEAVAPKPAYTPAVPYLRYSASRGVESNERGVVYWDSIGKNKRRAEASNWLARPQDLGNGEVDFAQVQSTDFGTTDFVSRARFSALTVSGNWTVHMVGGGGGGFLGLQSWFDFESGGKARIGFFGSQVGATLEGRREASVLFPSGNARRVLSLVSRSGSVRAWVNGLELTPTGSAILSSGFDLNALWGQAAIKGDAGTLSDVLLYLSAQADKDVVATAGYLQDLWNLQTPAPGYVEAPIVLAADSYSGTVSPTYGRTMQGYGTEDAIKWRLRGSSAVPVGLGSVVSNATPVTVLLASRGIDTCTGKRLLRNEWSEVVLSADYDLPWVRVVFPGFDRTLSLTEVGGFADRAFRWSSSSYDEVPWPADGQFTLYVPVPESPDPGGMTVTVTDSAYIVADVSAVAGGAPGQILRRVQGLAIPALAGGGSELVEGSDPPITLPRGAATTNIPGATVYGMLAQDNWDNNDPSPHWEGVELTLIINSPDVDLTQQVAVVDYGVLSYQTTAPTGPIDLSGAGLGNAVYLFSWPQFSAMADPRLGNEVWPANKQFRFIDTPL